MKVQCDVDSIVESIVSQIEHGPYPPSQLYGGNASARIANSLASVTPYIQKRLAFVAHIRNHRLCALVPARGGSKGIP